KNLSKDLNVPVLALSQLNRQVTARKGRPVLSDLRESGSIEQDADIVMFIHRPDIGAKEKDLEGGKIQPNVAELIIAKHRNGATGIIKLYFKSECTRFVNFNEDTGEPDEQAETAAPVKSAKPSIEKEELPPVSDNDVPPESADAFDAPSGVKSVDDEIFGG
ncbi:MAG: DnaB-like helicase C-terminal domain-containing protein, partial [Clostridia bacterium]|nr:DnaB-like helicase C-terminal domain-containing protein [Clostridia bacterium]